METRQGRETRAQDVRKVAKRMSLSALFVISAVLLNASDTALGSDFPNRYMTFVVPFGAGGPSDFMARIVAKSAEKILGKPIVVENRPGGATTVGLSYVARAKPDGYTLGFCGPNCATVPSLYSPPPFTTKSFTIVTSLLDLPLVLVVRKDLPVTDVKELLKLAKTAPGGLNYGNPGVGSSMHLSAKAFERAAGAKMVSIPYPSGGAALTDLLAGRIDVYFDAVNQPLPHIKNGTVKALAVTGKVRSSQLPNVPTLAELGVEGFDFAQRTWLVVPAGTPSEAIEKLGQAFRDALKDKDLLARLDEQGLRAVGDSQAQATASFMSEADRLGKLIRENNIEIKN